MFLYISGLETSRSPIILSSDIRCRTSKTRTRTVSQITKGPPPSYLSTSIHLPWNISSKITLHLAHPQLQLCKVSSVLILLLRNCASKTFWQTDWQGDPYIPFKKLLFLPYPMTCWKNKSFAKVCALLRGPRKPINKWQTPCPIYCSVGLTWSCSAVVVWLLGDWCILYIRLPRERLSVWWMWVWVERTCFYHTAKL